MVAEERIKKEKWLN